MQNGTCQIRPLFMARTGGFATYRIPALLVSPRGTLLAFCAARHARGDWAHIEIALRRSEDGGDNWQPMQIVASQGELATDNATPIADRDTEAVHLLFQVHYARCYHTRSDDDGRTFSPPVDITDTFEAFRPDYDWNVIAPGPGHGIQLANGRLLAPVWLSNGGRAHRPSVVATIYSDDHGQTWQRGEIVVRHSDEIPNPSETVAVELSDGRVMLNIRNESRRYRRLIVTSADGAHGWTEPVFDENLFEPVCFASLVRLPAGLGGPGGLVFANPDSSANPTVFGNWCRTRENLTVRLSLDEGRTWPLARVLDPGIAGYSDLAVGRAGTIYCLWEGGGIEGDMFDNCQIAVARFDRAWLEAGQSSDDRKGGAHD